MDDAFFYITLAYVLSGGIIFAYMIFLVWQAQYGQKLKEEFLKSNYENQ